MHQSIQEIHLFCLWDDRLAYGSIIANKMELKSLGKSQPDFCRQSTATWPCHRQAGIRVGILSLFEYVYSSTLVRTKSVIPYQKTVSIPVY